MSTTAPVGIFDSGVGGLSVAREIRRHLPAESLIYLADTAYCPYGGRPLEEIRARSLLVGHYLVRQGAKALVVACNSASGAALEALRTELDVPVVGMEPAVKPAARATRCGRVGVMATEATLQAGRFDRLMERFTEGVEVVGQPCPGLVELVEAGDVEGETARARLKELLQPLREAGVDTVVLGCTHYPFLRGVIGELMGPEVTLIDTGAAVARQTGRVLRKEGTEAPGGGEPSFRILTTGDAEVVGASVARLLHEAVPVEHVELEASQPATGQR